MTRAPHNPGSWPRLMRAETAAAYLDEPSVEAFLRRVGKVYPRARKISGRGRVWLKTDLDRSVGSMTGEEGAVVEDAASLL